MPVSELIERIPPQNIEAEAAVLGSMLLDKEAVELAIELLDAGAFYSECNRILFDSIVRLHDTTKAVDTVTLVEELKKRGSIDEVGGASYIIGLTSSIPTSANIIHYAKIVKEKAV